MISEKVEFESVKNKDDLKERPFYIGRIPTVNEGYLVGRHWHLHVEVLYVEKGPVELQLSSETRILNDGEMVVLYPGAVHGVTVPAGTKSTHFVVGFDPELFTAVPRLAFDLKHVLPYTGVGGCSPKIPAKNVGNDICQLYQQYAGKTLGYELAVCAGVFRLVHWIMEEFPHVFLPTEQVRTGDERVAIRQVVVWLASHFEQDIPAPLAAARAGMSYSYFAASFKRVMNCPFKRYLLLLRIRQSEQLLLNPQNTINDIAQQTGFHDASYFIKQFRLCKGVSPLKYRRRQLEAISNRNT